MWQPDTGWAFRLTLAIEDMTRVAIPSGGMAQTAGPGESPTGKAGGLLGGADQSARVTAASAVLGDFVRYNAGETIRVGGGGDWQAWADRLARHLVWVLEAVSP